MIRYALISVFFLSFCIPADAQNDSLSLALTQKTKQVEELLNTSPKRHIFMPLKNSIVSELDWYKKQNSDLLSVLDNIYLEDNLETHKRLAEERSRDTFVYLQSNYIGYIADSSLMNNVFLKEITYTSCWQWILLLHLRHFFKDGVDYHYRQRFITTDKEWKEIVADLKSFVVPDTTTYCTPADIPEWKYQGMNDFKIPQSPTIIIDKDQGIVYARFYSWNSRHGLSENHLQLRIVGGNQLRVISCDSRIIYDYFIGT